jgi:hypothetical protein
MKKQKAEQLQTEQDEMMPEYDFSHKEGVRGKYYHAYQQGHTVKIHEAGGTVNIQYFTLEDGAVMLEPDVKAYFQNSESVNNALRSLIALVPTKRKITAKPRKTKIEL